jgi:hypothetical protein
MEARLATCFGEPGTLWAAPPAWTYGTPGDDVIIGSAGNDVIWGQGGNDLICGNGGQDMLFSGNGRDRIQGGGGNDILYGEGGRDTLLGGPGGNILNGGPGTDRCLSGDTYVSCELPPVDKLLAECPTKREVARIDAEFDLSFEGAPTPIVLACHAGSVYLTPLAKRAYNTLLIMERIPFDAALPWTYSTLGDWFADNVDTIRFRDDITYSQYGPAGVINLQTGWPLPASQATDLWMEPEWNVGLAHMMILMVHEARHAEKPHTCDPMPGVGFIHDQTIAELGAWGVQYYLEVWLAEHTSPAFLARPAGDPDYYLVRHAWEAQAIKNSSFCNEP